jgi:NAD(P)-dependent dehydrogenase (short-subunit alcohol dehydrogenase family)
VLRYGEPREIATAVTLLASPLSGFINGVLLPIDGGGA